MWFIIWERERKGEEERERERENGEWMRKR